MTGTRSKRNNLIAAVICFIVAAQFLLPGNCEGRTLFKVKKRKITAILSPTLGVPRVVPAGGDFEIVISRESREEPEKIWASPIGSPSPGIDLKFSTYSTSDDSITYNARTPVDLDAGLYDLHVSFADGSSDSQYHSLKIIDEYKKDFTFAIIADIHFGDTRGQYFAPGKDFDDLRRNVLAEASAGDPEFILLVGDLTSMPNDYVRDYEEAWRYFRDYCSAPLYIVPGNHDGYAIKKNKGRYSDGRHFWKSYFGPPHFYFDYGEMRFVGIDNYDWPAKYRLASNIPLMNDVESINRGNINPRQFDWLRDAFASAGGKEIVPFAHLELHKMKGGMKSISGAITIPGTPKEQIIQLMRDYDVSYVFVGHMHRNETRDLGGIKQVMTNTSGSVLYDAEQLWGYNKVYVKDWKIEKIEYVTVDF